MADEPVRTTERNWAEEVQLADSTPEDKTAYQFTNGKKFEQPDPLYEQP